MQTSSTFSAGATLGSHAPSDVLMRLEQWLPPLLSVIAGMADLTGFFTLGNIFTAHVTGNLVVASAALVSHAPVKLAQVLAIPVFVLALVVIWLIARASGRRSVDLIRLLLIIQCILLVAVMAVSVVTKASRQPHGGMAGLAAMIAVAAMACQYALFRLALPEAVSTAVMTGNLTNTVLLSMNLFSTRGASTTNENSRLARSVWLLVGFLVGCAIAGMAVARLADWAWTLPVTLAGLAIALVTATGSRSNAKTAQTD